MLLAEPITKALAEVVTSSATFGEVRRVLEIIVPLAYRPSIKVACPAGSLCYIQPAALLSTYCADRPTLPCHHRSVC